MKNTATAQPACPSRRRGRQHFAMDYHCAAAASSSGVASNKKACANQLNQYSAIEDESHDVFTHTSLRFI